MVCAQTRYVFFNFEFWNLHYDHDNAWFVEYDHDDDSFTKKSEQAEGDHWFDLMLP